MISTIRSGVWGMHWALFSAQQGAGEGKPSGLTASSSLFCFSSCSLSESLSLPSSFSLWESLLVSSSSESLPFSEMSSSSSFTASSYNTKVKTKVLNVSVSIYCFESLKLIHSQDNWTGSRLDIHNKVLANKERQKAEMEGIKSLKQKTKLVSKTAFIHKDHNYLRGTSLLKHLQMLKSMSSH